MNSDIFFLKKKFLYLPTAALRWGFFALCSLPFQGFLQKISKNTYEDNFGIILDHNIYTEQTLFQIKLHYISLIRIDIYPSSVTLISYILQHICMLDDNTSASSATNRTVMNSLIPGQIISLVPKNKSYINSSNPIVNYISLSNSKKHIKFSYKVLSIFNVILGCIQFTEKK